MNDLKNKILDAALPAIVFDGWTLGTLQKATTALGLTELDFKQAFPGGVIDAVNYFTSRADEQMIAALEHDYDLPSMKIRERIATAVMVRLRAQAANREAIRRAMAVYAMPWHATDALNSLYATVDAIWRAAGDTSTDYNFYTKRLLLSKVYTTTVTVWLDDATPDLRDTEAFLRRRIENVMQIEKAKAKARTTFGKLEDWLPKFMKTKA